MPAIEEPARRYIPHALGWSVPGLSNATTNMTASLPDPQEACNESEEYTKRCTGLHQQRDSELTQWRFQRGLFFSFEGVNYWGVGNLLPVAFLLHEICRGLRRFCYVRLYGSRLEEVFGYANGLSWSPVTGELDRYNTTSNYTGRPILAPPLHTDYLYHRLRSDSAALLQVHYSSIPHNTDEFLPVLPWDPLRWQRHSGLRTGRLLDRCGNRFVTEPRFACPHSQPMNTLVHLRTGFADVPDEDLHATPPGDPDTARAWLRAACPGARLDSGAHLNSSITNDAPFRLISDGPGLLDVAATPYRDSGKRNFGSTRSTFNTTLAVSISMARQLVCTSRESRTLFTSVTSNFARPAVARSLCISRVERHDGASVDGPCPEFDWIFVRDMYPYVLQQTRRASQHFKIPSYDELRKQFPRTHPCKHADRETCRQSFLAATKVSASAAMSPPP